jgi:hypothetical protein
MKRIVLIVTTCTLMAGCSKNITGVYRHQICSIGPNCFLLTFHKDSSFEYSYFQDILGSGTLTGKYAMSGDTIRLSVAKDTAEKAASVKTESSPDTVLSITVFIGFAGNEQKSFGGQVTINDTTKLQLNLDGYATCKKMHVSTVKVNLATNASLRDSIFTINSDDNTIEIHTSEIPMMEAWMPKVYVKKGRKIYPLQFEPEMFLLGKNDYYKKK